MDTEKSALFVYCLELLFDENFNQKNVVFSFNNQLFTAKFYESNPFDESIRNRQFVESFLETFLENDICGYERKKLQEDLIGTFGKFEKFVKKTKIQTSELNFVPKEVTFLDKLEIVFPFFIIDSKEIITPVSYMTEKN